MYARRLGGTADTVQVMPFDRAAFAQAQSMLPQPSALLDAQGRPAHIVLADGSWMSLIHGVNVDGSFAEGVDPLTGEYWPGDAMIGGRPVYYLDLGAVPYMNPAGFTGTSATFASGFGGGSAGSVYIAPPTPQVPTLVSKQPPPQVVTIQTPPPGSATTTTTPATTTTGQPATGITSALTLKNPWLLVAIAAGLVVLFPSRR